MSKLTPDDFRNLLGEHPGWFGVTFVKKNGDERRMTAHMGVKKYLAGGPPAYNFDEKGLVSVWDVNAVGAHGEDDVGYRSINMETLMEVRAKGKKWKVEDETFVEIPKD